eukprot:984327-Rhodomonas_salina.2
MGRRFLRRLALAVSSASLALSIPNRSCSSRFAGVLDSLSSWAPSTRVRLQKGRASAQAVQNAVSFLESQIAGQRRASAEGGSGADLEFCEMDQLHRLGTEPLGQAESRLFLLRTEHTQPGPSGSTRTLVQNAKYRTQIRA